MSSVHLPKLMYLRMNVEKYEESSYDHLDESWVKVLEYFEEGDQYLVSHPDCDEEFYVYPDEIFDTQLKAEQFYGIEGRCDHCGGK